MGNNIYNKINMKQYLLSVAIILSLAVSAVHTADKLKMTLFVESLCPDCKHTVTTSFTPAINNGLLDMVDLDYVVAGNASDDKFVRGSGAYNFTCQHGSVECLANVYCNFWDDLGFWGKSQFKQNLGLSQKIESHLGLYCPSLSQKVQYENC